MKIIKQEETVQSSMRPWLLRDKKDFEIFIYAWLNE
jgi:hypothetical protein